MRILLTGLLIILTMSGCSQMAKDTAITYVKDHNLTNQVTRACYDSSFFGFKKCPYAGMLEVEINIVPYIPITSKFCFSIAQQTHLRLSSMTCIQYDFIR